MCCAGPRSINNVTTYGTLNRLYPENLISCFRPFGSSLLVGAANMPAWFGTFYLNVATVTPPPPRLHFFQPLRVIRESDHPFCVRSGGLMILGFALCTALGLLVTPRLLFFV